jgi:predicted O-methyltransferase YrrM
MAEWYSYTEALTRLCREFNPNRILEWGPGRSTKLMNELCPNAHIDSLEHDPKWYQDQLRKFNEIEAVKIRHINGDDYVLWPVDQQKYDLIFVDGRRRVECMKVAAECLAPGGVIVLHDGERPYYQPGIDYLTSMGFTVTGTHTRELRP